MRTVIHYVFTVFVMSFYGGKVCPYIDKMDLAGWLGLLIVIFGAIFFARRFLVDRALLKLPYESQTKTQFFLELILFFIAGAAITVHNALVHNFPVGSGLKMVLGCVALGFFAAVDLALEREREISGIFARTGREIKLREKFFPLTAKFSLVAILTVVFMMSIVYRVMDKDLIWIVNVGSGRLLEAKKSVLLELIYISIVGLVEIVNLIISYLSNLKMFFSNQNAVLTAVAAGNLESRVPVGTNDEFGVMARYTNKMIRDLDARNKALHETQLEIVKRLGRAAEYRDNETGLHVIRMSLFSARLGKAAGLNEKECEMLLNASPMHDIGKIGIPDHILLKPGKLDEKEFKIMKTHAEIGTEILRGSNSDLLKLAESIALTHQEKWDGSGYPRGLKGEEIPLAGRITAICDVFDALTSVRPYKKAWSVEDAVGLIEQEKGRHFDPNLVPLFKQVLPEILQIKEKYAEKHSA